MKKVLFYFSIIIRLHSSAPIFHSLEPQLVNRFPVDLRSGCVDISESHTFLLGPEEVSIRRRYISSRWDERNPWIVNQSMYVYVTMKDQKNVYLLYDLDEERMLSLKLNDSPFIYHDQKSFDPYHVTLKLEKKSLIVDFGRGIKRIYEKNPHFNVPFVYRLARERTFLGNWRLYYYDDKSRLVGIDVHSADLHEKFGSVGFRYLGKEFSDPSVMISLNGEPKYYYKFKKFHKDYLLEYIEYTNRLRESYYYGNKKKEKSFRLTKISYPTGGHLEFQFERNSKNEQVVTHIWRQHEGDDGRIKLADFHYSENEGEILFFDGQRQEYRYNDEGYLVSAKWGNIEQTHFYDQEGQIIARETKDFDGRILERKLFYDEQKNVIRDQLTFDEESFVQTNLYDDQLRQIGSSNSSGKVEFFSYVGDTNLIEKQQNGDQTNFFEYDSGGQVVKKRKENGGIVSQLFEYERNLNDLIEEREGFINRNTGDFEINVINRYAYDNKHQLIRKESFDRMDKPVFSETFAYTPRGLIEEKKSSTGYWVRFLYDERDKILKETTPDLEVTYQYDIMGRIRRKKRETSKRAAAVTEYQYDLYDQLIEKKEENGKVIRYAYDTLHRKVRDETGNWELDLLGNRKTFRDLMGHQTTYETTIYGEPKKVVHSDGVSETCQFEDFGRIRTFTDGTGIQTFCKFDEKSRLIKKNCEGRQFEYCYVGDKLVSVKNKEKEILRFFYDGFGRILREEGLGTYKNYHYNHIGQLRAEDEEGKVTLYERDGLGRVMRKWSGKSLYSYDYDEKGEVSSWSRGESDEKLTWRRIHDGFGDLLLEYEPMGGVTERIRRQKEEKIIDPMGRLEEILNDEEGHVVYKNFERGLKEESFAYDRLGALIYHKIIQEGKVQEAKYQYDTRGRLTDLEDPYGTRKKMYNERGELIWERRENGAEISFRYNPHGELIEVQSSDGTIHYEYSYDEWGNVLEIHNLLSGGLTKRKYDEEHRMILEKLENGLTIGYEYEGTRKRGIKLSDGSSIHYCYEQGEITRIYRLDEKQRFLYDHLVSFNSRGSIDSEEMISHLGRIDRGYTLDLKMTSITTPFHYEKVLKKDFVGNLLQISRNGETFNYPVDLFDRVKAEKENIERDSGGRIVRFGRKELSYDALDRLTQVREGSNLVKFFYDALNRLITREVNGKLDRFIYDEMIEIGLVDRSGTICELRILGYGKKGDIGRCVAIELGPKIYAPLNDLVGDIIGLVDVNNCQVVGKWNLTPYGEEEKREGILSPWRFQSKRIDETTGLVLFGFRVYLPKAKEYCQLDTRGGVGIQDLTSFNNNNPLRYCDPWGLEVVKEGGFKSPEFDNYNVSPKNPSYIGQFDQNPDPQLQKMFVPSPDHIVYYPGRENRSQNNVVVLMNGMKNTSEDCQRLAQTVAELYPGKIVSIYNQTGGIVQDLHRVYLEFCKFDTAPIITLRKLMYDLHKEGYKNIHLFAHSEGGLITKRAMEGLPWAVRENINIYSIASPTRIPNCYAKRVQNHATNKDWMRFLSRFERKADLANGHKISYQLLSYGKPRFNGHSIHSPAHLYLIEQILETIEDS